MIFLSIQYIPHLSCKFGQFKQNLSLFFIFIHTHACETLKRLLKNMPLMLTCSDQGPPILKKYPAIGCFLVGGEAPHQKKIEFIYFSKMFQQIFFLKRVQIYMKDADCAETNEKSFFPLLLIELWSILYLNHHNFR